MHVLQIYPNHFSIAQKLLEVIEFMKGELNELINMLSVVRIWIQLNIPKIEDGGNFGVSIQVNMLNKLICRT